jgi:two-component system, NtrC family, sensor kinase
MAAEGLKNESHVSDTPPDVPSTQRISLARGVPVDWLDRLLVAHCSIAPATPLEEAAHSLLVLARDILSEETAVGVCIPDRDGQQLVVRRSERVSQVGSQDASRIFPEFELELVLPIPGPFNPTLHVATDDATRFIDEGPSRLFADRLVQVFGAVLRASRAYERSQTQEIRYLREQMIQLERLGSLGQMVAGIVHELNNPLTSIVAYTDYLRKKAGEPADVERLLRISEAAERIRRFARDLTEYASPRPAAPGAVVIDRVIEQALMYCEHELDKTGILVERNFGPVKPVRGVADQLTQVFVNLFTNAAHAMREQGGLLTITTMMVNDSGVVVTITDDGHGIDPETLPRIFEPFFTTKTGGAGTGLGLSIVHRIVADHGGHIHADGNSPRGTVFHVELPAAAPEELKR